MAKQARIPKLSLPKNHHWRIGIVQSRFNAEITDVLREQAERVLRTAHVRVEIFPVAGCYEIAFVCQRLGRTKKFDGLVALGCLIKGETIHYEIIAHAVAHGIMDIVIRQNIPIGFGIITAHSEKQARARTWMGGHATRAVLDGLAVLHKR